MHYIIDGYNLMFRLIRAGDDFKKQRETLIKELNNKVKILKISATIVFDAQYQQHEEERHYLNDLSLYFTEKGETADECIVKMVKKASNPLNITVVTSDKKLGWLVRLKQAKTESVEDFIKWLNNKHKNTLKRQKEPLTILKIPEKKEIKKEFVPTITSSTADCFDFYLENFQKALDEIESQKPKSVPKKKLKLKKRAIPKNTEPALSNEDRWLMAFERDISEDLKKDKEFGV